MMDVDIRCLIRCQHTVYQYTLYGTISEYHHIMMDVNIPCLVRCQHIIYQHTLSGMMAIYHIFIHQNLMTTYHD